VTWIHWISQTAANGSLAELGVGRDMIAGALTGACDAARVKIVTVRLSAVDPDPGMWTYF